MGDNNFDLTIFYLFRDYLFFLVWRLVGMAENETNLLYQLARLYGVETSYYDGMGQLQQATVESLLIVLKALGASLNGLSDVNNALREHRQKQWQQLCEPVVVVWEGEPAYVEINSPANQ